MSDLPSRDDESPHGPVAGSAGAYALVLVLVTAFILYGSLFPFEYREQSYPGGPVFYLLSTWRDWDHRGDLLSNILLYMPFGFFGTLALPSFVTARRRALVMTVVGTALSCGVEITQFHDVGRVTSMGDVYANLIGSGVGGFVAVSRWRLDALAIRAGSRGAPRGVAVAHHVLRLSAVPLRADDRHA